MTSKIYIPKGKRKVAEYYARDNLVGVIEVHRLKTGKLLNSRRFYSSSTRKMLMDDWIFDFNDEKIYFLIRLDKIPTK